MVTLNSLILKAFQRDRLPPRWQGWFAFACFAIGLLSGGLLYALDANEDGLEDHWAQRFGVPPFSGGLDPDGDGRINLVESINFSNPFDENDSYVGLGLVFVFPDRNNNGMTDGWEQRFQAGHPAIIPGDDPDGDGRTNLEESIVGSNPWLEDRPRAHLSNASPAPGGPAEFQVSFQSAPGESYWVQKSTNLIQWTSERHVWGDGSLMKLTLPTGGVASLFFRVQHEETNGGALDTDLDGLPDWWEIYVFGSDPNSQDSDADGLSDGVEAGLGLSPTSRDSDGDGIPDAVELLEGTYSGSWNSPARVFSFLPDAAIIHPN